MVSIWKTSEPVRVSESPAYRVTWAPAPTQSPVSFVRVCRLLGFSSWCSTDTIDRTFVPRSRFRQTSASTTCFPVSSRCLPHRSFGPLSGSVVILSTAMHIIRCAHTCYTTGSCAHTSGKHGYCRLMLLCPKPEEDSSPLDGTRDEWQHRQLGTACHRDADRNRSPSTPTAGHTAVHQRISLDRIFALQSVPATASKASPLLSAWHLR
jgi:hypothetical protein